MHGAVNLLLLVASVRVAGIHLLDSDSLTYHYSDPVPGFLPGLPGGVRDVFSSRVDALRACVQLAQCRGVTREAPGIFVFRAGSQARPSATGEISWIRKMHVPDHDEYPVTTMALHASASWAVRGHTHTEERKFEVSEMMSYNFFSASDPDESEKEVEGSRVGVWSVNAKAIEAGRL